jgi:protein O-mannosyl-transferase
MYPKWTIDPSAPWQYLFPASALVALIVVFIFHKRIGKAPSVALFYFAGNLLPALGFFNLYYMRYSFAADHFQYLASIGLITFLVAVLWQSHDILPTQIRSDDVYCPSSFSRLFRTAPYRTLLSCGILLCLGILSWKQEYIYTNEEVLWTETLKKDPTNFAAHNNLGGIFLTRKETERAVTHIQAAIGLNPEYPEPHYNIAIALSRLGRFDEAVSHGQIAVKLKSNSASFHSVLASALWEKGDTALAVGHFRTATQISPTIPAAHHNLGLLYLLEPPTLTTVQPQEAITQLEKALALKPDLLQTQYTLAWVLATFPNDIVRDGKKAIYVAEQACQRTRYLNLQLLDALAAAYAESGQFSQAVQTAQTAVDLALTRQQEPLAHQISARLELYKVGKPYRDSLEQLRNLKATS